MIASVEKLLKVVQKLLQDITGLLKIPFTGLFT